MESSPPTTPADIVGEAPLGTGSAPAKIILIGEHAVVYGQPAIALPFPALHATATVWPSDQGFMVESRFRDADGYQSIRVRLHDAGPLSAVAMVALSHIGRRDAPWRVELESTVPPGRGLGSSAAVCVALARALLDAGDWENPEAVAQAALAGERKVHGTPSGIDHTTIASGTPQWFEGGLAQPLAIGSPLNVVVADSGPREGTGKLISELRARRDGRRSTYDGWLEGIGRHTVHAGRALSAGNLPQLGRSLDAAHLILQAMRLSSPLLDRLVGTAREAGAAGAKLSGAGGGGVMLAVVDEQQVADVALALRSAGARAVWSATYEANPL